MRALLLAAAMLCAGCATTVPEVLHKAHVGMKDVVSPAVEPVLKAECVKRATRCKESGISAEDCTAVALCQQWVAVYTASSTALHEQLALLNRLWSELKAAEVVK
jgi:hypothetical protein